MDLNEDLAEKSIKYFRLYKSYWEFILKGNRKQYPARLFIDSISLSNAGTYVCHTSVGNVTNGYTISITVKGFSLHFRSS